MPEKIPPQSIESEITLIGSLIIESSIIDEVSSILDRNMFYKEAHAILYDLILELHEKGIEPDLVIVKDLAERKGKLDLIGGAVYIAGCIEDVATPLNAINYANIIVEKWKYRGVIAISSNISDLAYRGETDADIIIDQTIHEYEKVAGLGVTTPDCGKISDISESIGIYDSVEENLMGLTYGFKEIDEDTFGMQPGDLIIIMGRPETLKTWIALFIAYKNYVARKNVLIIELQMNRRKIKTRLESLIAKVDSRKIKRKTLDNEEYTSYKRIHEIVGLRDNDIYIVTRAELPVCTLQGISVKVKQFKPDLLIVDTLDEVDLKGSFPDIRHQIVRITRGLKRIAEINEIPVMALHHTSKAKDKKVGKTSKDAAMDSDAIAQISDVLLQTQRDKYLERRKQLFIGTVKCRDDISRDYLLHADLSVPLMYVEKAGYDLFEEKTEKPGYLE